MKSYNINRASISSPIPGFKPLDLYNGIEAIGALSFDDTSHVFTIASGSNIYWYGYTRYVTTSAITCDLDLTADRDHADATLTDDTIYSLYFKDATGKLYWSPDFDPTVDVLVARLNWLSGVGTITNCTEPSMCPLTVAEHRTLLDYALTDMNDVIIASPAHDDIIKYNGSEWVNAPNDTGSVSTGTYYLDYTASDIGGTYHVLSAIPIATTEVIDTIVVNNNTVAGENYATPTGGLGITSIPAGIWQFNVFAKVSTIADATTMTFTVYKRTSGGTETELFHVDTPSIENTVVQLISTPASTQAAFSVDATDRLVIKTSATTTHSANVTVSFYHNGNDHYTHMHTPILDKTVTDHINNVTNPHSTTLAQVGTKATGVDVDAGTDDAKYLTVKAVNDSNNVPMVAPGTAGNLMTSNGTIWTSAAPATGSYPTILDLGTVKTSDATYSGIVISGQVDTNGGAGGLMAIGTDGHWDPADADAIANCYMLAIQTVAGTGEKVLLLQGQICFTAWNWTSVGTPIYAGLISGALVQDISSYGTDDALIPIGFPLSADTLYFNPYMAWATKI